ncbi:hypothetical protein [Gordonia sp. (in: high G+C Gram-positive bacteria)]|uniref:hypothetical protein n=1 Tax=Gordonia sp. (in: high G+C Gram-positive bacteria) TaxID=84139 RepID=UPI003F9BB9EB
MTGTHRGSLVDVASLLAAQDGVVARRQVLDCGLDPGDIRRLIRRREWTVVYPGIYVDHTGELTWQQRAWAAVLDAYPAALGYTCVLPDPGPVIHIVIDQNRTVKRRRGVVTHRRAGLDASVLWNLGPPRLRVVEAVLDVASAAATQTDAIDALTKAVNARVTTADRLLDALSERTRIRWRKLLHDVLVDIRDGTCSVLEHGYLTNVERPHGLPKPIRQAPTTVGRKGLRDLDYPDYDLIVELDGWRFHDSAQARDRDLERDLDAAVCAGRLTLRLGAGQVFSRGCVTARKVAKALYHRGWQGEFTSWPRCA